MDIYKPSSPMYLDCYFFSKKVIVWEKAGMPRDSQCQYLIKCWCITILISHWKALARSAMWHIVAHQCLWSFHVLWHNFSVVWLSLQGPYTIVSRKRGHSWMSAHPLLLVQFPVWGQSLLKWAPTLKRASCGAWKAKPQAHCVSEVSNFV